jgi:hypothetical protein
MWVGKLLKMHYATLLNLISMKLIFSLLSIFGTLLLFPYSGSRELSYLWVLVFLASFIFNVLLVIDCFKKPVLSKFIIAIISSMVFMFTFTKFQSWIEYVDNNNINQLIELDFYRYIYFGSFAPMIIYIIYFTISSKKQFPPKF